MFTISFESASGDETHDDRPARRISSVFNRLVAMTELSQKIRIRLDRGRPHSPRMNYLTLDTVVVPDTFNGGIERFTCLQMKTDDMALRGFLLQDCQHRGYPKGADTHLQSDNGILYIESTVGRQRLGNDQHGLGKRLDTQLLPALGLGSSATREMLGTSDFKCTGTRNEGFVLDGVLDRSKSVTNGVGDLLDGVRVGSLDEKGDTLGFLDVLDECVLFLAESVFVDKSGVTQDIGREVLYRILCGTTASVL
jgi:hypothetical protein